MSLTIPSRDGFQSGWVTMVKDECKAAIDQIESKGTTQPHETVHEIRKSFKKIRAAVRLVRFCIKDYKAKNKYFRNLGRKISVTRDATAMLETMDLIREQFSDTLATDFSGVERQIRAYRESLQSDYLKSQSIFIRIKKSLEEQYQEIDSWNMNVSKFDDIAPGIKKVYKRGRKGLQQASSSGQQTDFHEWRKRAKYLRYQLDILEYLWEPILDRSKKEFHKLTDHLGVANDLKALTQTINDKDIRFSNEENKQLFLALTNRLQKQHQEHALKLGKKLYHDKPSNFVKRIEAYWHSFYKLHEKQGLADADFLET